MEFCLNDDIIDAYSKLQNQQYPYIFKAQGSLCKTLKVMPTLKFSWSQFCFQICLTILVAVCFAQK